MHNPHSSFGLHKEEKTFGMLCHILSFAGFIIPFGHILGPLVIWLMKKDQSHFVDMHGKESVNFQISLTIYFIISGILVFIVIGILSSIALFICWLIFALTASIRASEGNSYHYPLSIRFIK